MSLPPKGGGSDRMGQTVGEDLMTASGEPIVGIEASWGDFRLGSE